MHTQRGCSRFGGFPICGFLWGLKQIALQRRRFLAFGHMWTKKLANNHRGVNVVPSRSPRLIPPIQLPAVKLALRKVEQIINRQAEQRCEPMLEKLLGR